MDTPESNHGFLMTDDCSSSTTREPTEENHKIETTDEQMGQCEAELNDKYDTIDLDSNQSMANSNEKLNKPLKICAVCGDKAIACNFNAITCESCKAFFRRNAYCEQKLRCLFDNKCTIDRVTRRFCSKCRLLKCFRIGMRRERILTEEEKLEKKVKILRNKQLKSLNLCDIAQFLTAESSDHKITPHTLAQMRRDSEVTSSLGDNKRDNQNLEARFKDASTSCPEEGELDVNQFPCSMIAECQFCASRLGFNNQSLEESSSRDQNGKRLHVNAAQFSDDTKGTNDYCPKNISNESTRQYPRYSSQPISFKSFQESVQVQRTTASNHHHQPILESLSSFSGELQSVASSSASQSDLQQLALRYKGINQFSGLPQSDCRPSIHEFNTTMSSKQSSIVPNMIEPDLVINESIPSQPHKAHEINAPSSSRTTPGQCNSPTAISNPELYELVASARLIDFDQSGDSALTAGNLSFISRQNIIWQDENYYAPADTAQEVCFRVDRLEFNEYERQLVKETLASTTFMFEDTNEGISQKSKKTLNKIVYFCDATLRKIIQTVKQSRSFKMLSIDDQIVLLKNACFKIILIRSAYHYQDDIEGWIVPDTGRFLKLDVFKMAKKSLVYEKHRDLIDKIPQPLRRDRIVMSILALILLFDSGVEESESRDFKSIDLNNRLYLALLRKYVLMTQPDPLAKYEKLVSAIQVIDACNEEYNAFFSRDFQPEEITPLLIEIFDISRDNNN